MLLRVPSIWSKMCCPRRFSSLSFSSRSWREACSCLQSPRLLILVLLVMSVSHSSHSAPYESEGSRPYIFNCNGSEWCGEKWREDRILLYSYNETDKLMLLGRNTTIFNCSGASDSSECREHTNVSEVVPIRVQGLIRDPVPEEIPWPSRNQGTITTSEFGNITQNLDIIWQLKIPQQCKMTLTFSQFDLEDSEDCRIDNFTVQISKHDREIHKYCRNLHRITIRSRRRVQLRVQMGFKTGSTVEAATPGSARAGIRAHVCISNKHDRPDDCNCNRNQGRRRRSLQSVDLGKSRPSRSSTSAVAASAENTGADERKLRRGGEKKRLLSVAQRYLSRYLREER